VADFGISWKTVADLPQWKTNFNFYDDILQKYMYAGPRWAEIRDKDMNPTPVGTGSFCSDPDP
jgi:hypothetical protein